MKAMWRVVAVCVSAGWASGQAVPHAGAVTHLVNGYWFDGAKFVRTDPYVEGESFTKHPDERRSVTTIDLHGGFVVPPYGDAHEHNFDSVEATPAVVRQYLRDGIFYAQGMTDTPEGAAAVVRAGMVDTPTTVDVTYAHGGLTGVNGHPKDVYESLANGFYYPKDDAQRALVTASQKSEGHAVWQIDSAATLDAKWPKILAAKPDLIKVYLLGSEHFKQATAADPQFGGGIDPALVPLIVQKAHAAGLQVAAHIDTPYDFHVAVLAGVDEMGHMPGYGQNAKEAPDAYRLADADIALAARQHVRVQATAGIYDGSYTPAEDRAARRPAQSDNLRRLKAAGVAVLVGSDHYGEDAVHEADYLQALGVWTNAEMLRMWSVQTPQDIFPRRKLGQLKPRYEASFLVLNGNPLERWSAVHSIAERWKGGRRLADSTEPQEAGTASGGISGAAGGRAVGVR